MKFAVEPWSPEYGVPVEPELEEGAAVEVDVEVPGRQWAPLTPAPDGAACVLFVDGVRRVDANVWIDQEGDGPALGLCATYAAGAVRCGSRAELVAAQVGRGLFTAAPHGSAIATRHGTYEVRATAGTTPEELWLGLQQRMGELETAVAAAHGAATDLIVVDGPLTGRQQVPGAVGYVKTHRVHYLPPALRPVLAALGAGQRTPLFLTTSSWSRYSFYVRLPGPGGHGMASLVRIEMSADLDSATAATLADRVTATLPRYASAPHKDPRAPQNLYPIGGLERALRRRLGDPALLYRSLRAVAAAA